MDKEESLQNKFGKIVTTFTGISKKMAEAFEEGMREPSNLICVRKGLLDFDLIENDIREIHRNLEAKGDKVLGSQLILDDKRNFMEIRTYTERDDKTFVITVDAEVKELINFRSDILEKLQKEGRVELNLEF
jgi:hypothetical protein